MLPKVMQLGKGEAWERNLGLSDTKPQLVLFCPRKLRVDDLPGVEWASGD